MVRDSIIVADYIIGFRDMKSAVSDRCAVYRNTPGGYDIFNILSRTDSRVGKVFVEPHESPFLADEVLYDQRHQYST